MSDSLRPHGLQPSRLLCPWDSPGTNSGVGCHALLQRIFPTSWIFSSCGRCSRLTTGTSGTRSGGLRKGQSTCELLGGLSGFLYHRGRGLRPCVESVPEPEDSSAVLTWILGYFWSLPRGVSPRLSGRMHVRLPPELWQQCHASLRLDQGICGFPTRLSHRAIPRATVV